LSSAGCGAFFLLLLGLEAIRNLSFLDEHISGKLPNTNLKARQTELTTIMYRLKYPSVWRTLDIPIQQFEIINAQLALPD
jgi:hypothetical protein